MHLKIISKKETWIREGLFIEIFTKNTLYTFYDRHIDSFLELENAELRVYDSQKNVVHEDAYINGYAFLSNDVLTCFINH